MVAIFSYLVGLGGLQTLCQSLKMHEPHFITVALDGILGILASGEKKKNADNLESNPYSPMLFDFSGKYGHIVIRMDIQW